MLASTVRIGSSARSVPLNAAHFGAYAYRLRNWWCNWLTPGELEAVAAVVRHAPHCYVDSILELTGMVRANGPHLR